MRRAVENREGHQELDETDPQGLFGHERVRQVRGEGDEERYQREETGVEARGIDREKRRGLDSETIEGSCEMPRGRSNGSPQRFEQDSQRDERVYQVSFSYADLVIRDRRISIGILIRKRLS